MSYGWVAFQRKKIPVLKYVKYHVPSDSQMPEKDNWMLEIQTLLRSISNRS